MTQNSFLFCPNDNEGFFRKQTKHNICTQGFNSVNSDFYVQKRYRVYQGFRQAQLGYGGFALGLGKFKVVIELPQKIVAHVKSGQK